MPVYTLIHTILSTRVLILSLYQLLGQWSLFHPQVFWLKFIALDAFICHTCARYLDHFVRWSKVHEISRKSWVTEGFGEVIYWEKLSLSNQRYKNNILSLGKPCLNCRNSGYFFVTFILRDIYYNVNKKKVQLDATICRHLFTAKSLYMFRAPQHPSSGGLKTVTASSGIGHNIGRATSFQRGLIRMIMMHGTMSLK